MKLLAETSLLLIFTAFFTLSQRIKAEDLSKINFEESINLKEGDLMKNNTEEDYRLPISVKPIHYSIHLIPYLFAPNYTFDGTVEITTTVMKSTKEIVLHFANMTYESILLSKSDGTSLKTVNILVIEKYDFLKITVDQLLIVGSEVKIKIAYTGLLSDDMRGFYRSSYGGHPVGRKWLAATHLEPVGARRMFPCFDEPALKATFQISVKRSRQFNAISNTPLESSINETDDIWIDTFMKTPIMSTYLVALVVSDFKSISQNPKYSAWARPTVTNLAEYSASVMEPLVLYFAGILGHEYQLPKLDMIALPEFAAGAMENWGLITFRESNMLYDLQHSPISAKQTIINVIAHEISHQWFGNLVSPDWWKYVWLSEGFARYFQYHAPAEIERNWGLESQFVIEQLQSAFAVDSLPSSHPMSYDVYSPSQISAIFDSISYNKAASVLRMVEKTFGNELFFTALHNYLKDRQYSSAIPKHLFTAIQDQVNHNNMKLDTTVENIMNTWTTQAGFPVVDVTIDKTVAKLSQKRFWLQTPKNITTNQLWWIPITWASKSNPEFSVTEATYWLSTPTNSLTLSGHKVNDWIIFNIQESGYYRVNYDNSSWFRIIEVLKSKDYEQIHEINRASLLDDLFSLARAGYSDYAITLSATQYLYQETNYIPWRAAFNGFVYLKNQLSRTQLYELFKTHVLTILNPIYDKLGFDEVENESHYDKLLRRYAIYWACEMEMKDCIDKSLELFARWQSNTSFFVPVNLRSTVYCIAVKYGPENNFYFLKKRASRLDVPAEKAVIQNALACSRNSGALNNLLLSAITENSEISYDESLNIFASVYNTGWFGAQHVLDFIEKHYVDMLKYYRDDKKIDKILNSISSKLSTNEQVLQLQRVIEPHAKIFSLSSNSLQTQFTRVQADMNWYITYSPRLFEWLDKTYPNSDYRLPNNIQPLTYDIHLTPYLEEDKFTFDGEVLITMKVLSMTSVIVMHANQLTIKDITVTRNYGTPLKVSSYTINSTLHKLSIYLNANVESFTFINATIKYAGILNDNMEGFYRSFYKDSDGMKHWLASTQFEKFGARQAFPCFDEPAFKAKFTVNIERPNKYHTLSNMPLHYHLPSEKINRTWDVYEESPIMSSYLVAFIVSEFKSIENTAKTFKIWARPDAFQHASEALDVGQKALDFLENFTGIPYPISKMELAAIPDFAAGAMENWGLVTFREYGLLTAKNITPAYFIRYMNTVIAHELVHMWFGDLVTCDWWEYLWLNEGFAEYLEWVTIEAIQPEMNAMQQFIVYDFQKALLRDSFPYMRPMNNKMKDPYDEGKDFTSVVYAKSASVIHMMRNAFGNKVFAQALNSYLNRQKYHTGRPEHLWSALQLEVDKNGGSSVVNQSVATLMNSWTSQPGYPVVKPILHDGSLIILQERFLVTGRNMTTYDQRYWIPITIATKSSPNFENTSPLLWVGTEAALTYNLNLTEEWFILNVQQSGYYRVNYEEKTWNRLIEALKADNFSGIPQINRAQIVDDLLNLARAEYISYSLALSGTEFLSKETDYLPWRAFFNAMEFLNERFDGYEVGLLLREYTLNLLDHVYNQLGFDEATNDTHLIKVNRQLILSWACKFELEHCVLTSRKLFDEWRNNPKAKSITPDAKPAIFCTSLKFGTYEDWKFLWSQYETSNFESEKVMMLTALGCSQNSKAIEEYLSIAISNNDLIRKQNVGTVFSSVYSAERFGVNSTLEFLMNNYTEIYNYYGSWGSVANLFSNVAAKFSTHDQINQLESFVNKTSDKIKEIEKSLRETIASAKENLAFISHAQSIEKFLLKQKVIFVDLPDGVQAISPPLHLIIFMMILTLTLFVING